MIENAPPTRDMDGYVALAWPIDILYHYGGPQEGMMAGYTMPKIDMEQYSYFSAYTGSIGVRMEEAELEELHNAIIYNILTILEKIHELGHVIGNVVRSSIYVNLEGRVAFVGTDSFQVRDARNGLVHRSELQHEYFLSPRVLELLDEICTDAMCTSDRPQGHNKRLSCFDCGPEDDSFGIAILFFNLLMGSGPFDSLGGTHREIVRAQRFPYNHKSLTPPYEMKARWEKLAPNWQNYFTNTFATERRYSADQVLNLLYGGHVV